MTAAALDLASDLKLPLDAVTQTFGVLAVRRAGKSNVGVVMAEQMYAHGLPWVAIDPKGDWWGIRAGRDGTSPGLSVLVFGGLHGDVPLEPTSGHLVADLVVDQRLTCVLDVSEMSNADRNRFLLAFCERLYRRNTKPLHVFCEEADEYIPQRVMAEMAKVVGAFTRLVKRGGFRGIGITLFTQRSASLNKDVLTQIENLFALRTTSPQDRKAILGWVEQHASGQSVVDELPTLEDGEAWVFSPHWLRTLVRVRFHRRSTYDSGATPKVGDKPRPPATLADVDLAAIKEAMAETIERAKAEDPKELRTRIRALEKELTQRPAPDPVRVEVPVPDQALVDELSRLFQDFVRLSDEVRDLAEAVRDTASTVQHDLRRAADTPALVRIPESARRRPPRGPTPADTNPAPAVPAIERPAAGADTSINNAGELLALPKAAAAVLWVLVQHDRPLTVNMVALLTGYRVTSSNFRNALSVLRGQELMQGDRQALAATDAGKKRGAAVPPLPTGLELIDWWMRQPAVTKAARAVLTALMEAYPDPASAEQCAAVNDYSASSSNFRNALSNLRTLELITGDRKALRLAEELQEALLRADMERMGHG